MARMIPAGTDIPNRGPVFSEAAVYAEVHRRILARASLNTQINMAAEAAAGRFTGDDATAYADALDWVTAMRAKGAELIVAEDATFADDTHWPDPSAAAIALAARF